MAVGGVIVSGADVTTFGRGGSILPNELAVGSDCLMEHGSPGSSGESFDGGSAVMLGTRTERTERTRLALGVGNPHYGNSQTENYKVAQQGQLVGAQREAMSLLSAGSAARVYTMRRWSMRGSARIVVEGWPRQEAAAKIRW